MRWSRRGADLLLQARCAVCNGTLGSDLGDRFDAVANQDTVFAIVACPPDLWSMPSWSTLTPDAAHDRGCAPRNFHYLSIAPRFNHAKRHNHDTGCVGRGGNAMLCASVARSLAATEAVQADGPMCAWPAPHAMPAHDAR